MAETSIMDTNARRTSAQILDVRENAEVTAGMIPGALHIPMNELPHRIEELQPDTPVMVVCRSGNRSAFIANALIAAGVFADTVTGGMIAWTKAGLPTT